MILTAWCKTGGVQHLSGEAKKITLVPKTYSNNVYDCKAEKVSFILHYRTYLNSIYASSY